MPRKPNGVEVHTSETRRDEATRKIWKQMLEQRIETSEGLLHKLMNVQKNSEVFFREGTIPIDHRLAAKLVPSFADRGCHVVSVTDT
jgi:hypothetical protein